MAKKKSKEIKVKPKKLTLTKPKKNVRLAIECSAEERKYMKMYAAHEDKTLNEFVLECVRMKMHGCSNPHIPNQETERILKETENGENLIHFDTVEDFLDSLDD